jgi:hypothetical protein
MIQPVTAGLTDCATVRVVLVSVAACSRSWSSTASMRKVCRVGRSIWDRRCRARRRVTATESVGANARAMSSRLEMRWEKTMVLTRPSRGASRAASSSESPERICVPKKIQPSVPRARSKRV